MSWYRPSVPIISPFTTTGAEQLDIDQPAVLRRRLPVPWTGKCMAFWVKWNASGVSSVVTRSSNWQPITLFWL
jgi:hypothetical protein